MSVSPLVDDQTYKHDVSYIEIITNEVKTLCLNVLNERISRMSGVYVFRYISLYQERKMGGMCVCVRVEAVELVYSYITASHESRYSHWNPNR